MAFIPWNEIDVMTEKERFIALTQTGRFTTAELYADFGISRKKSHKYLSAINKNTVPHLTIRFVNMRHFLVIF